MRLKFVGFGMGVALVAATTIGCTPKQDSVVAPPTDNPSTSQSSTGTGGRGPSDSGKQPGDTAPGQVAKGNEAQPKAGGAPTPGPGTPPTQNGRNGQAQGFGRFNNGGSSLGLLRREDVQDELKLTDEQKKKIEALSQSIRPQGGNNAQPPDPQAMQDRMKKAESDLKAILNADQNKRLQELSLQRQGLTALTRPEVAKQVGLTDAQQKQIQDIEKASSDRIRELMGSAGGPGAGPRSGAPGGPGEQRPNQGDTKTGAPGTGRPGGNFQEFQKIREETNTKILGVLNATQKSKWQSMSGKPFEFRRGNGMGGGQRNGGGRPNGGPGGEAAKGA